MNAMVVQSFIIISGTFPEKGMTVLYLDDESKIRSELGDWVIDNNDNRKLFNLAVNKEYYSLEFIRSYIAFTKYRTISDAIGRRGYFSITIAVPTQYHISWNITKILDDIVAKFIEVNLVDNKIKRNISGLLEIEEIFNNYVKSNDSILREWPDSSQYEQYGFLIYKNDEIKDYLQDPWREQYKGYRRVYFFSESLRSVLPSSDIFNPISDLKPRDDRFKLAVTAVDEGGKEVKDASIKINGKETDTIDEIRDSETIEIEVSRDFYNDYNLPSTSIKDLDDDESLKIKKDPKLYEIGGLELTITLISKRYEYRIILVAADDKQLKRRHIKIDDYRPKRIEGDNTSYIFEDLKFKNDTAKLVIESDEDHKYKRDEKELKIDSDVRRQEKKIKLQLKPIITEKDKKVEKENKNKPEGVNGRKIKIKNIIIYILSALVFITFSFLAYVLWLKDDSETKIDKEETEINEAADTINEANTTDGVEIEEKSKEEDSMIDSLQAELDEILAFANGIEFTPDSVEVYLGKLEEIGTTGYKDSLEYEIDHQGEKKIKGYKYVRTRLENMKDIGETLINLDITSKRRDALRKLVRYHKIYELSEVQNNYLTKIRQRY